MTFWRAMAVLLLGVLVGVGLAALVGVLRPAPAPPWGPGPWAMERASRGMGRGLRMGGGMRPPLEGFLAARLDLSPAQRESLRAVLERHRASAEAERRAYLERMRPQRDSMAAEIRALLTPEQREQFERLSRRWSRRGAGREPPPRP
jgi:Spy/CpxP family protein refolding chaperone